MELVVRSRPFASPVSRALARREGLDLAGVQGSGPSGRVVRADVIAALARGPRDDSAAGETHDRPEFDAVAHSIGRKLMARRLTESKQRAPHFYARVDCNIDRLLQLRAAHAHQARLSVSDFVIKAAALALRDVPAVNVSYTDAAMHRYRQIHIAVAVALEDGLVTPVIHNADQKTVAQIALEVQQLSARARAGKLEPGATRGGTFSISNLGPYGVREFTAVINPPQGAILAVGVGEPRAVAQDGQVVVANMMTVTLSADHRAIDGAIAARWLAAFRRHLEKPGVEDVWKSSLHAP